MILRSLCMMCNDEAGSRELAEKMSTELRGIAGYLSRAASSKSRSPEQAISSAVQDIVQLLFVVDSNVECAEKEEWPIDDITMA